MASPVTFRAELCQLLSRNSMENGSNTPDFVLAKFLAGCLEAFDFAVHTREQWHGRNPQGPFSQETAEPSAEALHTLLSLCGHKCSKESCRELCVMAPNHEGEYHSCRV